MSIRALEQRLARLEEAIRREERPLTVRLDSLSADGHRRRLGGPDDPDLAITVHFVPSGPVDDLADRDAEELAKELRALRAQVAAQ